MEIVIATESHVLEIVELWKEFMDFHKKIDLFFARREDGHVNFEKYLRELIDSEKAQVLAALENNSAVGFSLSKIQKYPPVYMHETYGYIDSLAIKPGYRRKGVGQQILAKIYDWFESRGVHRIEVNAVAKNHVAYSFWKKQGFKDYVHVLYLNK